MTCEKSRGKEGLLQKLQIKELSRKLAANIKLRLADEFEEYIELTK